MLDHREVALLARALAGAPEEFEHAALGKFRRAAEAPVHRIEQAADPLGDLIELRYSDLHRALRFGALGKLVDKALAVGFDFLRLFAENFCDLAQDILKTGPAIGGGLRKVCAAPERLGGGREKHGERPAALLAQVMQRAHVNFVDLRALLAVDLD